MDAVGLRGRAREKSMGYSAVNHPSLLEWRRAYLYNSSYADGLRSITEYLRQYMRADTLGKLRVIPLAQGLDLEVSPCSLAISLAIAILTSSIMCFHLPHMD